MATTRSAPNSFGDLLRRFRSAAGLTQEELAERAGLSTRGISDLERGVKSRPHFETVRMLVDALALNSEDSQRLLAAARPSSSTEPKAGALVGAAPLPRPLTPLIGRDRELAELTDLLQQVAVRLVTVTGSGGSGKTRLALEVGTRLQSAFADGVVFVDLTPLQETELVVPTIASTLSVRERVGQSLLETLSIALGAKRMLLIVDNFEHVLDAASEIAALLAACPHLSVLTTSREHVRVRGEHAYPLLPLSLPPADHLPVLGALAQVPAVALFLERATATHPTFALAPENAATVAAICRRLDGLPLAIELAAARVRLFPPESLLVRLERRLPLLTGGARDLPVRQRTMRDTIAWSYDLLSPKEQVLFGRLAVFAGGFTLDGAEAVGNHDGGLDAFGGVERLYEQSLLRQEDGPGGEPRFAMLETIAEFAAELLAHSGENAALRAAHAAWCLAMTQAASTAAQVGNDAKPAWDRLEAEQDNLRAALRWAIAQGPHAAATAFALVVASVEFWLARGYLTEADDWFTRVLAHADAAPPDLRAEALSQAAWIAAERGAYARANRLGDAAVALARELPACSLVGSVLLRRGAVAGMQGDDEGELRLAEEALDLFTRLGDWQGMASAANNVGIVAWGLGQVALATDRLEQALGWYQNLGNAQGMANTLSNLGSIALDRGDHRRALEHNRESLRLRWEIGDTRGLAWSLTNLAVSAQAAGFVVVAASLLASAVSLRERLGMVFEPWELPQVEELRHVLAAELGDAPFHAAWATGQAMPLADAVVMAMTVADDAVTAMKTHAPAP